MKIGSWIADRGLATTSPPLPADRTQWRRQARSRRVGVKGDIAPERIAGVVIAFAIHALECMTAFPNERTVQLVPVRLATAAVGGERRRPTVAGRDGAGHRSLSINLIEVTRRSFVLRAATTLGWRRPSHVVRAMFSETRGCQCIGVLPRASH